MRLAIGDPLLAPLELGQAPLRLLLLRTKPLLGLDRLPAACVQILLDLAPELDRLFLRLELGLPPERLRLAPGFREEELPRTTCRTESRPREQPQPAENGGDADYEPDENADRDRHARSWVGCPRGGRGPTRRQTSTGAVARIGRAGADGLPRGAASSPPRTAS